MRGTGTLAYVRPTLADLIPACPARAGVLVAKTINWKVSRLNFFTKEGARTGSRYQQLSERRAPVPGRLDEADELQRPNSTVFRFCLTLHTCM